ncbi:MAG: hypothetical protein R3C16_06760 [Hyphomonadaceae bacterium]
MRISDAAIVAAARLSHRYITDRFLPDKAIGLMDEAARLRMQVDSKPEELDELDRAPGAAEDRAGSVEEGEGRGLQGSRQLTPAEVKELETRSAELTATWSAEKQKLQTASKAKEGLLIVCRTSTRKRCGAAISLARRS